jgi:hypothetical protein
MEVVDGEDDEAIEEFDDQRRCRRLTMVPSLPAIEGVTMVDVPDDVLEADSTPDLGESHEFQNTLCSAPLAGFDSDWDCAHGVSGQRFRGIKQVNGSGESLEQLRSASPEVEDDPKESGRGEEESSPFVNELQIAMIQEVVRDHGNAKIIDRLLAHGEPGSKYPISGLSADKLVKGAAGCRGTRIRPWRGPLPRPKPASLTVLGDFLPRNLTEQADRANSEEKSRSGSMGKKTTAEVTLGKKTIDGPSIGVGFSQEQLRERAKMFGRPKLDIQAFRAERLGKHLISLPLARVQIPPTSSLRRLQVSGSIPRQEERRNLGPTYAEMAARLPSQGGPHRGVSQPQQGGGHLRQPPQLGGRNSATDWGRDRSGQGRSFGRSSAVRGRPGSLSFGAQERRREWRQANLDDRALGVSNDRTSASGAPQRPGQRLDGHSAEGAQQQRQT